MDVSVLIGKPLGAVRPSQTAASVEVNVHAHPDEQRGSEGSIIPDASL